MQKKAKLLLCLLFLLSVQFAQAQYEQYFNLHREGDELVRNGDYQGAVQKYLAATVDCPEKAKFCIKKIVEIINSLEKITQERQAKIEVWKKDLQTVQLARLNLEFEVGRGNIANDSLTHLAALITGLEKDLQDWKSIVKGIEGNTSMPVLAKDTLGGRLQYFFINSAGDLIPYLDIYDMATPFDATGQAIVERGNKAWVIDLKGKKSSLDKYKKAGPEAGDYRYMQLKKVPNPVFKIAKLKTLWLAENRLTEFPERMRDLHRLEFLDASNNAIQEIEALQNLISLKRLDLHGNEIGCIPFGIDGLKRLTHADFSHNCITTVPPSLFRIEKLSDLRLSYNRIEEIPGTIAECDDLKHLDLNFNEISVLPESFSKLQQLEYLGLTGNRIQVRKMSGVLDQIANLKNLKELHIGNNPCTNSEKGRLQVKAFFQQQLPACRVFFN
jgi:Leucine rich repeat/Leucine Rich repeats (2 copies)